MNALARWLQLPWYSAERMQRYFNAGMQAILLLAALLSSLLMPHGSGAHIVTLILIAASCAFNWMFVGARWLLVARDANALRLPHSHQRVASALASMATQTLLLPTVLLALLGLPALPALTLMLGMTAMALLWALATRWMVPLLGFVPAALLLLAGPAGWPSPTDPKFTLLGTELAALGLAIVTLRWRALMRADETGFASSWRKPMIFLLRGQLGIQGLSAGCATYSNAHAGVNADGASKIRLPDSTGQYDVSTLVRVLLGPPFAPRRRTGGDLRYWALGAVALLLVEFAAWLLVSPDTLRVLNAMVLLWTVMLAMFLVPAMASLRLFALFGGQPAAAVALLAHLPGLGDPSDARAMLLRTTVGVAIRWLAVAVLAIVALWLLLVGAPGFVALLLVAAAILATLTGATMLAALSGARLDRGTSQDIMRRGIYFALLAVLTITSSVALIPQAVALLAMQPAAKTWADQHPWIPAAFTLAWSALWVFALAQLRRHWRRFRRRAHPFLQR